MHANKEQHQWLFAVIQNARNWPGLAQISGLEISGSERVGKRETNGLGVDGPETHGIGRRRSSEKVVSLPAWAFSAEITVLHSKSHAAIQFELEPREALVS